MNITEMEDKVLKSVIESDYHDGRDPLDSPVWLNSIRHGIDLRQARGVYASLEKKGLIGIRKETDPNDSTVWITKAGIESMV